MKNKYLQVHYKNNLVGKLALTNDYKVAFQYDDEWLKTGFSISPFSLPLENKLFINNKNNNNGLFGVFADSLPDAWGNFVLDSYLKKKGIDISTLNVLDRLSIIGKTGVGALEYLPEYEFKQTKDVSFEELVNQIKQLFNSKEINEIDSLFKYCGSSGGTRPKFYLSENEEEYIVKMPHKNDLANQGEMEYDYYLCATSCDIDMAKSKILKTKAGESLFATKRFDRPKKHMISAAALLEVDFENVAADYRDLFKLTRIITNNNKYDLKQMFKRMCFNVYADNQDDHLKNIAYIYDDENGIYRLAPAYDLTYSISGYGEHATTINNKGKDILNDDLLTLGINAGLKKNECIEEMKIIKDECEILKKYK